MPVKRKVPRRTYDLKLAGELAGFHVTMNAMSGADVIAIRTGELPEAEVIKLIASRMVTHDFDVANPLDLDYWVLVDIMGAWGRAMEEAVLPPVTGEP